MRNRPLNASNECFKVADKAGLGRHLTYPVMMIRTLDSGGGMER